MADLGKEIEKLDSVQVYVRNPHVHEVGYSVPDWKDQKIDTSYWDKDTPCKQAETNMFASLTTDAFNKAGVDCWWYVIDWSNENEKIFGEDNDRYILRKFKVRCYTDELPPDERQFNLFGIEGLDRFHLFITKLHFADASKYNSDGVLSYREYKPKLGDIIQMTHNNFFYDVIEVKDRPEMILERAVTWDVTLRPLQNQHYKYVPEMANDPLAIRMDEKDILSQNDLIENVEKEKVLYDPNDGKNDPFGIFK